MSSSSQWKIDNRERFNELNRLSYNRNLEKRREQQRVWRRKWREENLDLSRKRTWLQRLKKFGLTEQDYNDLLELQDHRCAICKNFETVKIRGNLIRLTLDHDHKTNKIRGLLCRGCNVMIGHAHEDRETLSEAIRYLEKYA